MSRYVIRAAPVAHVRLPHRHRPLVAHEVGAQLGVQVELRRR